MCMGMGMGMGVGMGMGMDRGMGAGVDVVMGAGTHTLYVWGHTALSPGSPGRIPYPSSCIPAVPPVQSLK